MDPTRGCYRLQVGHLTITLVPCKVYEVCKHYKMDGTEHCCELCYRTIGLGHDDECIRGNQVLRNRLNFP